MANPKVCKIEGCGNAARSRDWCHAHYLRWRRHGDPLGGGTSYGVPMQYFREVVLTYDGDDCLPWPYTRDSKGYGQLRVDGPHCLVHRLVCEVVNGPPPTPTHYAAHLCGHGHLACVTKRHLSWKTPTENQADKLVHGTHSRGEKSSSAKITDESAKEIQAIGRSQTQRVIAARYGISQAAVSRILNGKSYA